MVKLWLVLLLTLSKASRIVPEFILKRSETYGDSFISEDCSNIHFDKFTEDGTTYCRCKSTSPIYYRAASNAPACIATEGLKTNTNCDHVVVVSTSTILFNIQCPDYRFERLELLDYNSEGMGTWSAFDLNINSNLQIWQQQYDVNNNNSSQLKFKSSEPWKGLLAKIHYDCYTQSFRYKCLIIKMDGIRKYALPKTMKDIFNFNDPETPHPTITATKGSPGTSLRTSPDTFTSGKGFSGSIIGVSIGIILLFIIIVCIIIFLILRRRRLRSQKSHNEIQPLNPKDEHETQLMAQYVTVHKPQSPAKPNRHETEPIYGKPDPEPETDTPLIYQDPPISDSNNVYSSTDEIERPDNNTQQPLYYSKTDIIKDLNKPSLPAQEVDYYNTSFSKVPLESEESEYYSTPIMEDNDDKEGNQPPVEYAVVVKDVKK